MRKIFLVLILLAAVIGVAMYMYSPQVLVIPTVIPKPSYNSAAYGISFSYPETYVLKEHDDNTGERKHHVITLTDKTALAEIPKDGEGPPMISLDVFQNDIDKLSIDSWVTDSSFSNFKLVASSSFASTTVASAPALTYTWDGLYRSESTVFAHSKNIMMFTVGYLTPRDQIKTDFSSILTSVRLY